MRMDRKTMKKLFMLLVLSVLLCSGFPAAAEEPAALEYSMVLSRTVFTDPETISVSIGITNTGGQETGGPVRLYYPDGMIVAEFGGPVLKPGETRTWIGEWRVTRSQLREGKISFMVLYEKDTGEKDKDGNPVLKKAGSTLSKRITYDAPAWESEEELLQTLEDFFHCWLMQWPDDMLDLCSAEWRNAAEDPRAVPVGFVQEYTPRTWEVEDISGPEADGSVTAEMLAAMKKDGSEQAEETRISIRLLQEDGKWVIDPESIVIGPEAGSV